MNRLAAVALIGFTVLMFACEGPETPELMQGSLDLEVKSVLLGQPMLVDGDNQITISWPKESRQQAIKLLWKAPASGGTYQILRATAKDGPFNVIASPSTAEYVDVTAQAGTTYFYKATARSAEWFHESKVLTGIHKSLNKKVLGFNVYRSRYYEGPFYRINPLPVTGGSYIDGDLPADSIYFYKVALDFDGELVGHKDGELGGGKTALAFFWTKGKKTKPAKHKSIKLAVHPCVHGVTKSRVRFVVRVHNQKGDIVKGLKWNNFKVATGNTKVKVKMFWPNLPWGMQMGGVVMDYSGSMYATKRDVPLMENMLISGMVGAKAFWDRYGVIKYDNKVKEYVAFTTSLAKLLKGITALNDKFGGSTAFYDAAIRSFATVSAQQHPIPMLTSLFHKKFVVGFTDGEENASKYKAADVVATAKQVCAPFFGVGFDGQVGSVGHKKLQFLADNTGGAVYIATKTSSGLFEKVSKMVDNGYSLVAEKANKPAADHKVTFSVNYKGLKATKTVVLAY